MGKGWKVVGGLGLVLVAVGFWSKSVVVIVLGIVLTLVGERQKGGSLESSQEDIIARLRQAGYRVEVCKGWWEAREVIENYLTGEIPKGASRRVEPAANQQPLADRRGRRAVQGR